MNAADLRVLVTRAAEQAGDLATELRDIGCDVIEIPLIVVVEPVDGGAQLRAAMRSVDRSRSGHEWIVLTSPNAAARSLPLLTPGSGVRLAAIGPGTAAVCRELGYEVDLVPARSVGEGLVEIFPEAPGVSDGSGRKVLLPRAESARDIVADGLRAKGWQVDIAVAYRTVSRVPSEPEVRMAKSADVVLCASSSAARSMVEALGATNLPPFVLSIGPQTTQTLVELGVEVFSTADPHTLDGLVAAVKALVDR